MSNTDLFFKLTVVLVLVISTDASVLVSVLNSSVGVDAFLCANSPPLPLTKFTALVIPATAPTSWKFAFTF